MRELTPTAVLSESPGVGEGGTGGMFPVPFTIGEKSSRIWSLLRRSVGKVLLRSNLFLRLKKNSTSIHFAPVTCLSVTSKERKRSEDAEST